MLFFSPKWRILSNLVTLGSGQRQHLARVGNTSRRVELLLHQSPLQEIPTSVAPRNPVQTDLILPTPFKVFNLSADKLTSIAGSRIGGNLPFAQSHFQQFWLENSYFL